MTTKASSTKVLVSGAGGSRDRMDQTRQEVADALGVLPEDVVLLPGGLSVSVVEVPAELASRREKADKENEAEGEKAGRGRARSEKEAQEAQQESEMEAIRKQQAEQAEKAGVTVVGQTAETPPPHHARGKAKEKGE